MLITDIQMPEFSGLELLDSVKERTFLALDVYRSLKLKAGEDPFIAQHTFHLHNLLIQRIVVEQQGMIHSTAGDGMMICFESADSALATATLILQKVKYFNQFENQLSNDFILRIGMHTGPVIIEDSSHINTMFSKTLDLAGHIQKHATPGRIEISADALAGLSEQKYFRRLDREVDGLKLYSPIDRAL